MNESEAPSLPHSPAAGAGSQPTNPPAPPTNQGPRASHEAQPASKPPAPTGGPPKAPPPKNPGFVTCTIDGHEVVVKPGTNMIEAAKNVGSEIPYYCYHPRLSIAANCRMCLVQASNAPKLVPACQTPLTEGISIKTTTAMVTENQRSVMEFLLLNHPVDCSICDQAGECKLQDYYMRYDFRSSRLEGKKVLKNKRKTLGPLIVLDQERCILCTRCVRFMDEVPKEPQLGVFGRGSHERIDVFPGTELNSNYSGNTVDICPVGALLNRDFRFKARAWFLSTSPSVCTGCSRGCNISADFYGQDTYRYRPRENEAINKSWLCDQGRLSYKYLNVDRTDLPSLGRGEDRREATRQEAVAYAATKLKPLAHSASLAVLASPLASNEDLLAGLTFARYTLGAHSVYEGGRPSGQADHFLMTADKNPNREGLHSIAKGLGLELLPFESLAPKIESGAISALWAIGTEIPGDELVFAGAARRLQLLIAQSVNVSALTAEADVLLPASTHLEDEGTFINLDGIIQRFRKAYPPKGASQPHWKWTSDLMSELEIALLYTSARQVFKDCAPKIAELASFDWDKTAPINKAQPGINPMPSSADGRPPGYREQGIPRVRGI